jgi:NDP-sugar pyrophosphorylase family protein
LLNQYIISKQENNFASILCFIKILEGGIKVSKFKGFDWTEIGKYWNLFKSDDDIEEEEMAKKIKNFLWENFENNKEIINDAREFVQAIIDCGKDYFEKIEIFKGLLNIKDDETFVKYFCILLEYMWV